MDGGVLSARFWIQTIVATLFTMVMIYAIKRFSTAYKVPVISELSKAI